jgi:hypothetical protein
VAITHDAVNGRFARSFTRHDSPKQTFRKSPHIGLMSRKLPHARNH